MKVVIGVDSGGSKTRALAVTLGGERVGYAESGGGNPAHDARCRENIREAIAGAAGPFLDQVIRVVAGIAGFDRPERDVWVNEATDIPGLTAVKVHLNDADIAHFAAFEGAPGILTIQGTGSMIHAVLEDGRRLRSGDLFHYARGGAVWVGGNGMHAFLSSPEMQADAALRNAAFELWQSDSMETLREALAQQTALESAERSRRHGTFARAITGAATAGSGPAGEVCAIAAREIAVGIRLLGTYFEAEKIGVGLVGACVRSPAMRSRLAGWLNEFEGKRYQLFEPETLPVVGAVAMALRDEGVALGAEQAGRLTASLT